MLNQFSVSQHSTKLYKLDEEFYYLNFIQALQIPTQNSTILIY